MEAITLMRMRNDTIRQKKTRYTDFAIATLSSLTNIYRNGSIGQENWN